MKTTWEKGSTTETPCCYYICSFFMIKEVFKVKNRLTTLLLFFFVPKIWVGRTTLSGGKKRGCPNSKTGHGKKENVCEMSKNEKCTCKACKTIVFHCQIRKFVTFLLPSSSWLLKFPIFGGKRTGKIVLFCFFPWEKHLKNAYPLTVKYLNCQRFCSLLYFKQHSQRGKCASPRIKSLM